MPPSFFSQRIGLFAAAQNVETEVTAEIHLTARSGKIYQGIPGIP